MLLNSVHNFTPSFFNFYLKIIHPSAPISPVQFTSPYQNFVSIADAIKSVTCPALPNLPDLILATRIQGTSARSSGLDSRQKQKPLPSPPSIRDRHRSTLLYNACVPGALFSVSKRPGRETSTRSYTPLPLRVHGVTLS